MLFNSPIFFGFFAAFYVLYLLVQRRINTRNLLILVGSYIFYGWWDWRFLFLIVISTISDFLLGRAIGNTSADTESGQRQRKRLLIASVVVNLSILGFFKYFNFFIDSLTSSLALLGLHVDPFTLNVILPVGISFYTFQTMSYTFDVYRNQLQHTNSFLNFAAFVAFFPQLVAGPIERASNLLPQFDEVRPITPERVDSALFLIGWGFFKKMVIADNIARVSNEIFNNYTMYQGADILLGVLAFTVQIYCDFSGYSDIARGIARLLGFELMVNFRLPYFAVNPSDFWNRWHISLSTWLRDYLYIPLGGNRNGVFNTYRNLFLTMLLGGLWHGAAWNFVLWGAFHGVILILYRMFEKNPAEKNPWGGQHPYWVVFSKMGVMLVLTMIGWLLFRASTVDQIVYMLTQWSFIPSAQTAGFLSLIVAVTTPLFLMELYQYISRDLLIVIHKPQWARVAFYTTLLTAILLFGVRESAEFIYFQF